MSQARTCEVASFSVSLGRRRNGSTTMTKTAPEAGSPWCDSCEDHAGELGSVAEVGVTRVVVEELPG